MTNYKKGNRYSDDFRKMFVNLYHPGQPVKDLSSEYGVSEVTIYAWIKKFNPVELEDGSSMTPDDYIKLQIQMLKVQEENEILKKLWPHSRKNADEVTDFISKQTETHSIQTMCKALDIPRNTYYTTCDETVSERDPKNAI